jgi:hypothetical protein
MCTILFIRKIKLKSVSSAISFYEKYGFYKKGLCENTKDLCEMEKIIVKKTSGGNTRNTKKGIWKIRKTVKKGKRRFTKKIYKKKSTRKNGGMMRSSMKQVKNIGKIGKSIKEVGEDVVTEVSKDQLKNIMKTQIKNLGKGNANLEYSYQKLRSKPSYNIRNYDYKSSFNPQVRNNVNNNLFEVDETQTPMKRTTMEYDTYISPIKGERPIQESVLVHTADINEVSRKLF